MPTSIDEKPMRVVGRRKERQITFHASGELLAEGARFNDEIHKMPTGNMTCIPKGVYHFKTHEEANAHMLECACQALVKAAMARKKGEAGG